MTDEASPPSVFLKSVKDLYDVLRSIGDLGLYSIGNGSARFWIGSYIEQGLRSQPFYRTNCTGFRIEFMDSQKLKGVFRNRFNEVLKSAYELGKYSTATDMDLNNYLNCVWPHIDKMKLNLESDDGKKADFWDYGEEILKPVSNSEILDIFKNYTYERSS